MQAGLPSFVLDGDTRLKRLNQIAIRQMRIMLENNSLKKLEDNL